MKIIPFLMHIVEDDLILTKSLSHSLQYPIKVNHRFKVTAAIGYYLCGPPCVRLTVEEE